MNEIVIHLFYEEDLEDLELLHCTDRVYVPTWKRQFSALNASRMRASVLTVRNLRVKTGAELLVGRNSLRQRRAQSCRQSPMQRGESAGSRFARPQSKDQCQMWRTQLHMPASVEKCRPCCSWYIAQETCRWNRLEDIYQQNNCYTQKSTVPLSPCSYVMILTWSCCSGPPERHEPNARG